jgi:hypothetical protein
MHMIIIFYNQCQHIWLLFVEFQHKYLLPVAAIWLIHVIVRENIWGGGRVMYRLQYSCVIIMSLWEGGTWVGGGGL